jgi:hypothetical protein
LPRGADYRLLQPYALRDQQTPSVPKGPPATIDPRRRRWRQGARWMQWVRRDPLRMGPKPSREAISAFRRREPTFGPAERADGTRTRLWDRTPEGSVPRALVSLVLGSRWSFTRFL